MVHEAIDYAQNIKANGQNRVAFLLQNEKYPVIIKKHRKDDFL
jgi:hypothetical protein